MGITTDTKSSAARSMPAAAGRTAGPATAIETAMLRLSSQVLAANADVIRRVAAPSTVADDLDELSDALALAAAEPASHGASRPTLRIVR